MQNIFIVSSGWYEEYAPIYLKTAKSFDEFEKTCRDLMDKTVMKALEGDSWLGMGEQFSGVLNILHLQNFSYWNNRVCIFKYRAMEKLV